MNAVQQITALYVAFFDRPADAGGQQYWLARLQSVRTATDMDASAMAVIAAEMAASPEFSLNGVASGQVIDSIYQNLFGRVADTGGAAYWSAALAAGQSLAAVTSSIINAAQSDATMNNRIAAAGSFTASLQSPLQQNAAASVTATAAVKAYLAGVTADPATLTTATTALPALLDNLAQRFEVSQTESLYVALFHRAADPGGLLYWQTQIANGASLSDIARGFTSSPEFARLYANTTPAQIIDALYLNSYGHAADAGGRDYWQQKIASGQSTAADVAAAVIASARSTDALANKTLAATTLTQSLHTAQQIEAYSAAGADLIVQQYLANVTADPATLTAALANTDTVINTMVAIIAPPPPPPPPPPSPTIFTAGVDTYTTTDPALVYTATLGTAATLNAGDSLSGAGNTLNITDTSGNTATDLLPAVTLSGITTLSLTTSGNAGSAGGGPFSLTTVPGLTSFILHSSGTAGDFLRLGGVSATITSSSGTISNLSGAGTLDITDASLTSLTISGTTGAVTLHDTPTGTLTVALNQTTVTGGITDAANHYTAISLGANTASTIDAINGTGLTSITVTSGDVGLGTDATHLMSLPGNVTTVSASGDNANSFISVAAPGTTVTLGNGNNTVADAATSGTSSITFGNGNNSYTDSGAGTSQVTFGNGLNTADLGGYANDLITIGVNAGYASAPTTANLVVSHAAAGDNIALQSISSHFQTQYLVGTLGTHGSAAGTISYLESLLAANSRANSFALDKFGGDTFIVATASGTLGATDTTVIHLIGYTGNVTWTGTDNVLHLA